MHLKLSETQLLLIQSLSKNNGNRRDFPQRVQEIWLKVDLEKFEGRCPCCCEIIIANKNGWIKDKSQSAHFNDVDMNGLMDGARICVNCHAMHRERGKDRPYSIRMFWKFCEWEYEKKTKSLSLGFTNINQQKPNISP